MARKLFLHVGFAKCGSTSLQEALREAPNLLYPKAGINGAEHLSLPLFTRGVDDWTRQFFDEAWAAAQHGKMLEEIAASDADVAISSERLAAMKPEEIETLGTIFAGLEIHIVIVRRAVDRYLNSTWRHAVFHHDYGETYETFLERMARFSFGDSVEKFGKYFPVHVFDMDSAEYPLNLAVLMGTEINLPTSNVGVPFDFARLLQETHALMGSQSFKKIYVMKLKKAMLEVRTKQATASIEPISAPLF